MRLWTIHPRYLDRQGLLALWREGLLAQAVLRGETKGYRNHPQLVRFREQPDPVAAIATYLDEVYHESLRRGYHFNQGLVHGDRMDGYIDETDGQLRYEWGHLESKLCLRSPEFLHALGDVDLPDPHPLFRIGPGTIRRWERTTV